MTLPILIGFIVGIFVSFFMIGFIIGRKRKKLQADREVIRRTHIMVKEEFIKQLKRSVGELFSDAEELKGELTGVTRHLKACIEKGDIESARLCEIRGNVAMEQIEAKMEEAEKLVAEVERQIQLLEELENGKQ